MAVWYTDADISLSPVTIHYPFRSDISKIQLTHNTRVMGGFGMALNWFALRLAATMFQSFRSTELYGEPKTIDLSVQFSFKKTYNQINYKRYSGYVLKNSFLWNPEQPLFQFHDLSQDIHVDNINFKNWWFRDENFHMNAFIGNRGMYNKELLSWFFSNRIDYYRLYNKNGPLVPEPLQDIDNSKTKANQFTSFEIGMIPGIVYVNKWKNWQYGIMFATGPCLQLKSYTLEHTRTLVGFTAPYDLKLVLGYNTPRFFAMFHFGIDNKTIRFSAFRYNQNVTQFKLVIGFRQDVPK